MRCIAEATQADIMRLAAGGGGDAGTDDVSAAEATEEAKSTRNGRDNKMIDQ